MELPEEYVKDMDKLRGLANVFLEDFICAIDIEKYKNKKLFAGMLLAPVALLTEKLIDFLAFSEGLDKKECADFYIEIFEKIIEVG